MNKAAVLAVVIGAWLGQQAATRQPAPSPDEWKRRFDDYLHEVAARAGRYPERFVLDDSRETIYEGRGE